MARNQHTYGMRRCRQLTLLVENLRANNMLQCDKDASTCNASPLRPGIRVLPCEWGNPKGL